LWDGDNFEHEVLDIKPGLVLNIKMRPFSQSKTLLICDAIIAVSEEPPPILTSDSECTRAL
jgi:hypothetical protein